MALRQTLQPGQQVGAAMRHVGLLATRIAGTPSGSNATTCWSSLPKRPASTTSNTRSTSPSELRTARLSCDSAPAVTGLKPRRVDKYELRRATRAHADDAVTRGLRLARCDADLLTHQRIEQGRLCHVGPADNCHGAAACGRARQSAWGRHPRTATGRPADRWPSAHRAGGARPLVRRPGASARAQSRPATAPGWHIRPRRSARAPARWWR